MKHRCGCNLYAFLFALLELPSMLSAQVSTGYLLMFRPQSVDMCSDMPEDWAKNYPNQTLVLITFQPVTHAATKDGSNLQPGEGGWLDRGMRPSEPGKIRLLLPEDDPMLVHTLRTSEGPFVFRVVNSNQGYMETVPLSSPQLESVPEGSGADSISTSAANPAANTSASSDPDLELNRVYNQLLKDHKDDSWFTMSLRETQRAWLQFRDARADLESVIAGKTRPDGPTINRLTQARLEDLKHVAIDGLPADFGPISTENGWSRQIIEGYNQFRQAILKRKSADLLAAWIAAQQAWNGYSDSERRFDSHTAPLYWDFDLAPKGDISDSSSENKLVSKQGPTDQQLDAKASTRLDQAHWADLKTLAIELGLSSDNLRNSSEPVFDAQLDSQTILSPRKDLRVEFSYPENSESQKAVVLSNTDNSQKTLDDPGEMVGLLNKSYNAWSDVNVSPDSHWIFQIAVRSNIHDLYGDANLYEVIRTTPVELRQYFKGESFARVAFRELKKLHGQESFQSIHFGDWKPDKLIFFITSDAAGDNSEHAWRYEYYLKGDCFQSR